MQFNSIRIHLIENLPIKTPEHIQSPPCVWWASLCSVLSLSTDTQFRMSILERLEQMEQRMAEISNQNPGSETMAAKGRGAEGGGGGGGGGGAGTDQPSQVSVVVPQWRSDGFTANEQCKGLVGVHRSQGKQTGGQRGLRLILQDASLDEDMSSRCFLWFNSSYTHL